MPLPVNKQISCKIGLLRQNGGKTEYNGTVTTNKYDIPIRAFNFLDQHFEMLEFWAAKKF